MLRGENVCRFTFNTANDGEPVWVRIPDMPCVRRTLPQALTVGVSGMIGGYQPLWKVK